MAENNQTNDIAEMLMRLRQSVEADRAKAEKGEESPVRRADGEKDELELQLEGLTRGLSATKKEAKAADIEEADAEEDDSDPWYDEEPEELDEDEFEEDESEEDVDIEIASDEERESEEDEADPWFTVEKKEEPIEEEPIEEEPIEEEPIEEEPIEEEPIEEEPIEEEPIYPDDDEPLTPEMIMESEEDEPKGDEEDDLPSWYAEETEREAPGRRSDDIDDGEGETFFDFDDNAYGSGMILSEPEEDTEEPTPEIEAEYTEDPTPEIEAEYIEEPTPEIEEENIEESVPEIKEEEDTEEPTPEIEADCIEDPVPEIEEEEDTEEPVHEIEDEEESLFLELKQMAALEDSDTVLDSTDLGLLRNLGYAAPEAENEPPSRTETESTDNGTDGDVAYDYDGGEYVIRGQVGEIRTGYMAKKRGILMRLLLHFYLWSTSFSPLQRWACPEYSTGRPSPFRTL